MKKKTKKSIVEIEEFVFSVIKVVSGSLMIILGLAGLILPIIPGIILIIAGIFILNDRRLKYLISKIIAK